MKNKVNIWIKALYGFLMTVLGFSSCDDLLGIMEQKDAYGQPYAEFKITGEVKSQDGKPLKGIRVIVNPRKSNGDYGRFESDTLFTDADGKYSKDRLKHDWPDNLEDAIITFDDIDGVENGGEFQSVSLQKGEFSVENVKKGSGNWDSGDYLVTADATMTEKKED